MSKIENFEIEPSEETWAMRRQGRGLVAPARKTACRCGRCRLYRWYPPLLVVSTIMTAVFCFLYLTKPVFLEAPAMKVNDEGKQVPPGYMIAGTGSSRGTERTAVVESTMPKELDPGRLSFAGEPREVDPVVVALAQPEPIDLLDVPSAVVPVREEPVPVIEPVELERARPMPVRVSVGGQEEPMAAALPGGFQPLRVKKADRPLFQSLTKTDLARLEARRSPAPAEVVSPDDVSDPAAPDDVIDDPVVAALMIDGIDEVSRVDDEVVADLEEPEVDGAEEPVMKASFIGEFYQDGESEGQEILNKTVMR